MSRWDPQNLSVGALVALIAGFLAVYLLIAIGGRGFELRIAIIATGMALMLVVDFFRPRKDKRSSKSE